jgi:electron transport complex protein RnfG
MISRPVVIAALILAAFATVGVGLVSATYLGTKERIAANERLALLRKLHAVVPADSVDNDIIKDRIEVHDPQLLGTDTTAVYRGRKDGKPVAAVYATIIPSGYSGPIKLLVAVRHDGTLGGVRAVAESETPGLGDNIDDAKTDWILQFNGKSLGDPPLKMWKVKRDGGYFDQLTGATITPRAVVKAVHNSLKYFSQHRDALFAPTATKTEAPPHG